jgi:hypothetical protein
MCILKIFLSHFEVFVEKKLNYLLREYVKISEKVKRVECLTL